MIDHVTNVKAHTLGLITALGSITSMTSFFGLVDAMVGFIAGIVGLGAAAIHFYLQYKKLKAYKKNPKFKPRHIKK